MSQPISRVASGATDGSSSAYNPTGGGEEFGVGGPGADEGGEGGKAKKGSRLKLPKGMRHVAGKAARQTTKAAKGASKMANAVSKKLGVPESSSQGQYQAAAPADMIGAAMLQDDDDCGEEDEEDGGHELAGWTTSSSEGPHERGEGSPDAPAAAPASGSENERPPRRASGQRSSAKAKAKAGGASWREKQKEGWDPKNFAGKPRPLQCGSIWDIPTTRFPEPEKRPLPPAHTAPDPQTAPAPATEVAFSGGSGARGSEVGQGCWLFERRVICIVFTVLAVVSGVVVAAFAWQRSARYNQELE